MTIHAFEFLDHPKTPRSIRTTLLEILECCSGIFRPYYQEVADDVFAICERENLTTVVELGAGMAPMTEQLAKDDRSEGMTIIPSDLIPEEQQYRRYEREFPGRVSGCYESIDYTKPHDWPERTLLMMVATLHHVPEADRVRVLKSLTASADGVAIFEPVRKKPLSMLLGFVAMIPALLTPLVLIRRRGRFRRFLWCWLVPVAAPMFLWDGWISCLRQWNDPEWKTALAEVLDDPDTATIESRPHSQIVHWPAERPDPVPPAERRAEA